MDSVKHVLGSFRLSLHVGLIWKIRHLAQVSTHLPLPNWWSTTWHTLFSQCCSASCKRDKWINYLQKKMVIAKTHSLSPFKNQWGGTDSSVLCPMDPLKWQLSFKGKLTQHGCGPKPNQLSSTILYKVSDCNPIHTDLGVSFNGTWFWVDMCMIALSMHSFSSSAQVCEGIKHLESHKARLVDWAQFDDSQVAQARIGL